MNIYLLRHGETEYNKQKRYQGTLDIPLSAEGLARLQKAPISPRVVYISPPVSYTHLDVYKRQEEHHPAGCAP